MTFRWGVLGRAGQLDLETRARLAHSAARVAAFSSLGVGVGLLGAGYRQADELRFPGDPLGDAITMLLGTSWATAWWWAIGGSVLLLVGAMLALRSDGPGWALAAVGLLPVVVFPSLIGHASGAEARWIAVGLDVVHVAAGGAWIGTLGLIVLVGRSWLDRIVPPFSAIALGSVVALVVTGGVAGWRLVGSLQGYVGTPYGRTLLLKIVLFLGVATIGALNWRRLRPRLGSPGGDVAMGRSASAEFVLGQVVLLVTAVLVRMAP